MTAFAPADRLHRLIKEALDRGTVGSIEEGEALFRGYCVVIEIGAAEVESPSHQAILLTTVALASRVFLGGVIVRLGADAPLLIPTALPSTVHAAVCALGGHIAEKGSAEAENVPRIVVGREQRARQTPFEIRAVASGWRGGIVPIDAPGLPERDAIALAGMLAAALAVNEAFLYVRAENAAAGYRTVGMSLWDPRPDCDWFSAGSEPPLTLLPSRLWLLGLGHLGQAYLWGLGLLPYASHATLQLTLQDVDVITPSTPSTSILSSNDLVGQMKTRAMAAWAERRGFSTRLHERVFAADFRRQEEEPAVLLCGLDNALGRRALDQVGFDFIVEAGLGRGHRDFRTLRLHTLPAERCAARIWAPGATDELLVSSPAYTKLLAEKRLDKCGVTLLAGKAVGAPFVGAVAASLAIAEVLRLLHGGPTLQLIDVDLECLEHREVIRHGCDFSALNPGFQRVMA